MRKYCQMLGLINLLICSGCGLWMVVERSGSGAPVIAGAVTFNMAMAWLFLAGVHRNAAGERVWHFQPAFEVVVLFLVLVGGFFAYGQKG